MRCSRSQAAMRREAGATNVEFLKGYIEAIPLPSDSIDVVISNCVINLAADKPAVFREIGRVLRPGGRIGITDIVADDELTPDERATRGSYVGCIAGALSFAEFTLWPRGRRPDRCVAHDDPPGDRRHAQRHRPRGEAGCRAVSAPSPAVDELPMATAGCGCGSGGLLLTPASRPLPVTETGRPLLPRAPPGPEPRTRARLDADRADRAVDGRGRARAVHPRPIRLGAVRRHRDLRQRLSGAADQPDRRGAPRSARQDSAGHARLRRVTAGDGRHRRAGHPRCAARPAARPDRGRLVADLDPQPRRAALALPDHGARAALGAGERRRLERLRHRHDRRAADRGGARRPLRRARSR